MKFDVSQANTFLFCPAMWEEKYVRKRALDESQLSYLPGWVFGKRFHKLLEEHYTGKPAGPPEGRESEVEDDCQVMLARYKAWYPEEAFEVVEWETNFEVPLSEKHSVTGRWDAIVRMKETGRLKILDTKTEKRGSKANTDQRWAALDQGSIYMYAGQEVFGEAFDGIILNVCTKASPKGQVPPDFRRLNLERSREQIDRAVSDFCKLGDVMEYALEHGAWQARNECINAMTGWRCEFHDLHLIGESPETLFKYREAEDYLNEH
ncbi:MAG: PD-(D/E)XK nuclease family protein [Thaumarchaeota archaeon]|nr:PD-(D/E)XK nuclease family protein [Nitrososphaerota archaeon]